MLEGAGKIWERWCWKVLPRCGMCNVYCTIGFLVGGSFAIPKLLEHSHHGIAKLCHFNASKDILYYFTT